MYIKVYIKGEADLPKKEALYFVFHKRVIGGLDARFFDMNYKEGWLNNIEWYLQEDEVTDEDIEAWVWKEYAATRPTRALQMACRVARAMHDGEIKHIENQGNICRVHGCNNPVSEGEYFCNSCDQRFHEPEDKSNT